MRRLTAILQLEECICYKGNVGARWLQDVKEQLANLRAKFKEDTDRHNPKEKETLNKLNDPDANRIKKIIDVKKARLDYDNIIHQMEANIIKKIRNNQANTYVGIGSHGQISKSTKRQILQPLKVLEIPGKGGTITADENKVNEIARNAWKKIFDGNTNDQEMLV